MPAFGEFKKVDCAKCPVCDQELDHWGDTISYPDKSDTEHWHCKHCNYERNKLKRLKNE